MCSVCLSIPCMARCPGASEPTPIYKCSKCGEGIYEGDKFYDGIGEEVCEECISDMSAEEILEMVGEKLDIA